MLVSDWTQKILLCPIVGLCFGDVLIGRIVPANSIVCRTCLAPAGELSSRSKNEAQKTNDIPYNLVIDKLDRLVPWIYPYAACQQDNALLPTEELNSGTP